MARLPLIVAAALAVGASCTDEPKVRPERVYLEASDYCLGSISRLISEAPASMVSLDLLVIETDGLTEARVGVVAQSACESIDISAVPAEFLIRAVGAIIGVLGSLPELPEGGHYALVGGVHFGVSDCGEAVPVAFACGMSDPFGAGYTYLGGPDAGPVDEDDRLMHRVMCPSNGVPCLQSDDCATGVCAFGESVCARDEQCRGATCGDGGTCVEGRCENAAGACVAQPCNSSATCTGADCQNSNGVPCVPATCQDYIQGEELAPLYPVAYPSCAVLYEDARAAARE
jgi:hypothetical protein